MWDYFNPRCEPKWSAGELQTIVRNAYAYAQSPQGAESAEAEFGSDPLPSSSGHRRDQIKKPKVIIKAGTLPRSPAR